jgi:hypothetical protein
MPHLLAHLNPGHIEKAASQIDAKGLPADKLKFQNQYWFIVNGKEYPFKHLVRVANSLSSSPVDLSKMQSTEGYRNYLVKTLHFDFNYYPNWVNFFTRDEMDYFHSVAGVRYTEADKEILQRKLYPLRYKVEEWAKKVTPDGFTFEFGFNWQNSGYVKNYFWARIFRPEWKNKGIYFNLGITGYENSAYCFLNHQYVDSKNIKKLSEEKQEKFNAYLAKFNYKRWDGIKGADIENYNWDKLITETKDYLIDNIPLYDAVVTHVWDANPVANIEANSLVFEAPPKQTYRSAIPGSGVVNYEERNRQLKQIGDAGEKLVIELERVRLFNAGKNADYADKNVFKVKDREGYDIRSVDENENEIFIEVKTTVRDKSAPFYLTFRELSISNKHSQKYYLYRIFNFDIINKSGQCYILTGDVSTQLSLDPIVYIAGI